MLRSHRKDEKVSAVFSISYIFYPLKFMTILKIGTAFELAKIPLLIS